MQPDRRFWVYGTQNCPYCQKAKELILAKGYTVVYIDITGRPELTDPSWKTVPQIFETGRYIGGYEDLDLELSTEIV